MLRSATGEKLKIPQSTEMYSKSNERLSFWNIAFVDNVMHKWIFMQTTKCLLISLMKANILLNNRQGGQYFIYSVCKIQLLYFLFSFLGEAHIMNIYSEYPHAETAKYHILKVDEKSYMIALDIRHIVQYIIFIYYCTEHWIIINILLCLYYHHCHYLEAVHKWLRSRRSERLVIIRIGHIVRCVYI